MGQNNRRNKQLKDIYPNVDGLEVHDKNWTSIFTSRSLFTTNVAFSVMDETKYGFKQERDKKNELL